jgi:dTDP-4-dehydrorhamnose 3,5-epimerase
MDEEIEVINLEKHETKDIHDQHINGSLTVIYRDYDKIIKNGLKMIYVSSINTGEIKGPHLHKKRDSYFVCIHGKVIFVIKKNDGKYIEVESSSEKPVLIKVPKGIASAHYNSSKEIGRVLVLADLAWKPDDNEMENVEFEDYEWPKLKKMKNIY